jgi:hypothetical protein
MLFASIAKASFRQRKLRSWLRLKELVDVEDEATLNAIASFVLRVSAYMKTKPDAVFRFPPLTVIIVVPNVVVPQPVKLTTSRMRTFW